MNVITIQVDLFKKDGGKWYGSFTIVVDHHNFVDKSVLISECYKHYTGSDYIFLQTLENDLKKLTF